MESLKEWTFLLYANGHNELEPETWQSVVDLQKDSFGTDIHVVAQISREEKDIVSLLRPQKVISDAGDDWHGVRRYTFLEGHPFAFYAIDSVNMAYPDALCDFLIWGMTHFPAKRYMLSVTGHIYQFVGMCPDYSGETPLMMGFPELSSAIQSACVQCQVELAILILDTCYASTVEILYELGRHAQPQVKNVLTYIGKGPLGGLPYSDVLAILKRVSCASTEDLLCSFVNSIPVKRSLYGIIALQINHELLELVKQLFDKLASTYRLCKGAYGIELTPEALLSDCRVDYPWSHYLNPIYKLLKMLILAIRPAENADHTLLPIHILYQKILDTQRKQLYNRLAFSRQNDWAALLCDGFSKEWLAPSCDTTAPLPVSKNILAAFLYAGNESLSIEELTQTADRIIERKHWKLE